ncbi:hypothetical protein BHE74_00026076 [Ensete ventricosum]|nr:hypothetical protein BHE74_00026076 [Ensete ventricosum]
MQSQSSKQRKRAREKDGKASGRSKITRFCEKDPSNVGSNVAREDGLVPWIDEGLENDYGDEFLGFGAGPPAAHKHRMAAGRSRCSAQQGRTPSNVAPTIAESDAGGSDAAAQGHHCKVIAVMASSKQMQQPSGTTTTLMNFSHFARPVALAKACLRNGGGGRRGGLRSVEKLSTLSSSNPFASTPIQRSNGVEDVHRASGEPSSSMMSLREAGLGEQPTARKNPEAAAASMCSGNFAGAGLNQRKHGERTKEGEGEESEYNSEDLQDEWVGIRRRSKTKRSRVAEVHNLSEKRRRNKINEKMRALQQLLPHHDKLQVQVKKFPSVGVCLPSVCLHTSPHNSTLLCDADDVDERSAVYATHGVTSACDGSSPGRRDEGVRHELRPWLSHGRNSTDSCAAVSLRSWTVQYMGRDFYEDQFLGCCSCT